MVAIESEIVHKVFVKRSKVSIAIGALLVSTNVVLGSVLR